VPQLALKTVAKQVVRVLRVPLFLVIRVLEVLVNVDVVLEVYETPLQTEGALPWLHMDDHGSPREEIKAETLQAQLAIESVKVGVFEDVLLGVDVVGCA
jgi:hypothetical protein